MISRSRLWASAAVAKDRTRASHRRGGAGLVAAPRPRISGAMVTRAGSEPSAFAAAMAMARSTGSPVALSTMLPRVSISTARHSTAAATAPAARRVRAISVEPSNRTKPSASIRIAPRRRGDQPEEGGEPGGGGREQQRAAEEAHHRPDLRRGAGFVVEGEEREFRPLAGRAVEHERPGEQVQVAAVDLGGREAREHRHGGHVQGRRDAARADIDQTVPSDHGIAFGARPESPDGAGPCCRGSKRRAGLSVTPLRCRGVPSGGAPRAGLAAAVHEGLQLVEGGEGERPFGVSASIAPSSNIM